MDKLKKIILYLWLIIGLFVLYAIEAWEYIYLRQHGSEHPNENLIMGCMLLIYITPIIIALIIHTVKNKGKAKENSAFSWESFAIAAFVTFGHDFLQNHALQIVNTARALPTQANIDSAVADIITLYVTGFVIIMAVGAVLEYIDRKKKKAATADSTDKLEKEWF